MRLYAEHACVDAEPAERRKAGQEPSTRLRELDEFAFDRPDGWWSVVLDHQQGDLRLQPLWTTAKSCHPGCLAARNSRLPAGRRRARPATKTPSRDWHLEKIGCSGSLVLDLDEFFRPEQSSQRGQ